MTSQSTPAEGVGGDRRTHPRYRLVRPLTGFVEHGEERFAGSVLDLSVSGFLLYLPGGDAECFRKRADSGFGEVVFGPKTFGGFGSVANVRALAGGPGVGFRWDDYVYEESGKDIDELIAELTHLRLAGCVRREGTRIRICGHLSLALSVDLHTAITAGGRQVSLAETVSLDSSGLNLLLDVHRSGVVIEEDVHPDIRQPLERFHLIPAPG